MKFRIALFFLWLVIPATGFSHAEFFFPKVFSPTELETTGFVFLNTDSAATIIIYPYLLTAGGLPASPQREIRIAPGNQVALRGSELFPNPVGGWVYLLTDGDGVQAFWLNYDAGITYLDGAEAQSYDTIGPDHVIPLVAGRSELNVVSPNYGSTVRLTIQLFGDNGELAPAVTPSLSGGGALQADVAALFPAADMSRARYLRIRTNSILPVASCVVIRGYLVPQEIAVVNGVNVSSRTDAVFPHVVSGTLTGANYTTVVGVTNLATSAQTVTITFTPDTGSPVQVTRSLAGGGSLRDSAQSLFSLGTDFRTGWVRVTGPSPLTGFTAYADTVGGSIAVVPVSSAATSLFFGHIAEGVPQWQTGIALLNATDTAANVEVFAITPTGGAIGQPSRFTLDPGKKTARALHELIAQTEGVNGGFVFARTTNGVALSGIELFYTRDLKVLSNVAAGKPSGLVTFRPPTP